MSIDIKLHKNDLPDDLDLGNVIAVDGEFMGLNVRRDPLCLIHHVFCEDRLHHWHNILFGLVLILHQNLNFEIVYLYLYLQILL